MLWLEDGDSQCSYPLMPALGEPMCSRTPFGARGTTVFFQLFGGQGQGPSKAYVYSLDQLEASQHPLNPTRTDWLQLTGARNLGTELRGDTLVSAIEGDQGEVSLIRYSATSVSTPVEVILKAVVSLTWGWQPALGYSGQFIRWVGTDAGTVWVPIYGFPEQVKFSRYLFYRAP